MALTQGDIGVRAGPDGRRGDRPTVRRARPSGPRVLELVGRLGVALTRRDAVVDDGAFAGRVLVANASTPSSRGHEDDTVRLARRRPGQTLAERRPPRLAPPVILHVGRLVVDIPMGRVTPVRPALGLADTTLGVVDRPYLPRQTPTDSFTRPKTTP